MIRSIQIKLSSSKEDDVELKDFEVTIGNYTFAHPIMNAAGHCKKDEHFQALVRSASSGIVVGSVLPVEETRLGNEGQVYVPGRVNQGPLAPRDEPFALNSLDIPCLCISYYEELLPFWVEQAKAAGKHLIFNIAGFKTADYVELARLAHKSGVYILEVNFGCPNLSDEGKHKPTISYDPDLMSRILANLSFALQGTEVDI